jgi:precorrin-6A synthase
MKKVLIIGIGAGNPDYVTVQAINALNEVDVFFVIDKGKEKEELLRLRKEICERYVRDKSYRTIEAPRSATRPQSRFVPISCRVMA